MIAQQTHKIFERFVPRSRAKQCNPFSNQPPIISISIVSLYRRSLFSIVPGQEAFFSSHKIRTDPHLTSTPHQLAQHKHRHVITLRRIQHVLPLGSPISLQRRRTQTRLLLQRLPSLQRPGLLPTRQWSNSIGRRPIRPIGSLRSIPR